MAEAALVWEPSAQAQVVFVDRPAVIRQDIRNDGDKPVMESVQLKLMQLSSSLAAPIPGWGQKKSLEVPAKQTIRAAVDLSLPKVTSPTRFRVTWNNEAGQLLGSTEVVGCPVDIFQSLRLLSEQQPIGLLGETEALAAALRQQGCVVQVVNEPQELKDFKSKLVIAAFTGKDKAKLEEFGRLAAQYAKEWGGKIVWLQQPDNLPLAPEPAVCVFSHGQGTMVVVTGLNVSEVAKNPLTQARLVWLVELAQASEENRLLLLGRLFAR